MGSTLNQPIGVLALDASNNLYAGTNNGSDTDNGVFKYVSGTWVSIGSPDGTGIQSIAINNQLHPRLILKVIGKRFWLFIRL